MKKISQILKETTIPQIIGNLAVYHPRDDGGYELVGKCALGILACESDNVDLHLSNKHIYVESNSIIESYNINTNEKWPYLDDEKYVLTGWDFDRETLSIDQIIMILNDTYKFTFKEIAELLEITFDL